MNQPKNLSTIVEDYVHFFFTQHLYTAYDIGLKVVEQHSYENVGTPENPQNINYDLFYESDDFVVLKYILMANLNLYSYCPVCNKSMYLSSPSKHVEQNLSQKLLTSETGISTTEEYKSISNYAQHQMISIYNAFTSNYLESGNIFTRNFICSSSEKHSITVVFKITGNRKLIKVGQYPPIVEFESQLKIYRKTLGKVDYSELQKAIGLKTHGNAIGAYTYLRRIFERLLYKRFETVLGNDPNYEKLQIKSVKEKIEFLGIDHLPSFMVENTTLYSIISKGIHELSEEDCISNFEIVYKSVILILEEELIKERTIQTKINFKKKLNAIHSNVKDK